MAFFPMAVSNCSIKMRNQTRSFAQTGHSFACSALFALLARSAALVLSLTHSQAREEGPLSIFYSNILWSSECRSQVVQGSREMGLEGG